MRRHRGGIVPAAWRRFPGSHLITPHFISRRPTKLSCLQAMQKIRLQRFPRPSRTLCLARPASVVIVFSLQKHPYLPQPFTVHSHIRSFSASSISRMPPVPKTMSGILIEAPGDAHVMKWKTDLMVPDLGEGQILVKNEWVGVNFIDT